MGLFTSKEERERRKQQDAEIKRLKDEAERRRKKELADARAENQRLKDEAAAKARQEAEYAKSEEAKAKKQRQERIDKARAAGEKQILIDSTRMKIESINDKINAATMERDDFLAQAEECFNQGRDREAASFVRKSESKSEAIEMLEGTYEDLDTYVDFLEVQSTLMDVIGDFSELSSQLFSAVDKVDMYAMQVDTEDGLAAMQRNRQQMRTIMDSMRTRYKMSAKTARRTTSAATATPNREELAQRIKAQRQAASGVRTDVDAQRAAEAEKLLES